MVIINGNMNQSKRQTILITGISGFIGSRLAVRLVQEGNDVHGIIRERTNTQELRAVISQLTLHTHDGTGESLEGIVRAVNPEVVYHIAANIIFEHSINDVACLIDDNLKFSTQLIDAMVRNKCFNLINTGTFWQHYNNGNYYPVCLYAATKQAFEMILEHYIRNNHLNVITLKLFDTYGPNDPRPKIISLLRDIADTGRSLKMTAGEQMIDIVYIGDVVRAYQIASMELLRRKERKHCRYAVSSGKQISLVDFVKTFESVLKKKLSIEWGARPYRSREVMTPWSDGLSLPGWNPEVSLEEGIRAIL